MILGYETAFLLPDDRVCESIGGGVVLVKEFRGGAGLRPVVKHRGALTPSWWK